MANSMTNVLDLTMLQWHRHRHRLLVIITCSIFVLPGDQEGLFMLPIQLRKCFYSVIYNTATGYVLWVYLTDT
jgi:hypothetical protein